MRVCVVGSGGREHALADVLSRDAVVSVAPGNPGIPGSTGRGPEESAADLYVIGPETPLVDGLADRLRARGALVFGPGANGARLEGSKAWMKAVLDHAGVATARHASFDDVNAAVAFLRGLAPPYVVKTDGLAAGKGVLVTTSLRDAIEDVAAKLSGRTFGGAGRRVVIEEGLSGPEVSLLCLTDGNTVVALPSAQDFKRLGDDDTGPNTGGMGAYSPVAAVDAAEGARLARSLVEPTLAELRRRDVDYRGVLYAGLMLTDDGPRVLEFNVRFGDPEAQVVLPRLRGDVAAVLAEAAAGWLRTPPEVDAAEAVTVVGATKGYPTTTSGGEAIEGLEAAAAVPGVKVYCSRVARAEGRLVTAGGRVLAVTALAATLAGARRKAYEAIGQISWPGMQYRGDIALTASR